jgi:hypothetical protein
MIKRPLHEPAQDEIDTSVDKLVGAKRELHAEEAIREVQNKNSDNNPQEKRQLIFEDIPQLPSTFLIAAGR